MTTDDRVEELRRLYKDAYNEEISVEEAREMASRLVTLYELLARKLPNEQKSLPKSKPPDDDPPRKIGFQI
jgi:aldehyde:ferredoxin oxidoreductase